MSKPTFSLVGLCLLAMAFSGNRASASPAEESDRQFLSQLENGKAAPAAAVPTAPVTQVVPEMRATQPQINSQEPIPKATAIVKKTTAKAPKLVTTTTGQVQQLPEVADGDMQTATASTTATTVTVVRTADSDHSRDRDHDRDHHFFHRLFAHMLSNHPEDW